ncbi:sugar phosphate isomerase/epimerase [Candidatus Bathyarchaeota archaeon]|nr:sugar phosphate isomerase/epimerase [Candidatus Bathyarchaeota archaeon]MBS7617283.1 sugar phosphate isomerase/epimerase [Candidatus Bathyarchaeota archaeon]
MKFSICNELFKGWSLSEVFNFVSKLGYHAVELAPFTFTDDVREVHPSKREAIRKLAVQHGLEVTGLHWLLVKPEGLHINHPNPNIRQRTIEYLKCLGVFCRDLGGEILVFGSPRQRMVLPNVTYEDAWKWTVEAFKECTEYLLDYNVILCIEPLRSELTNFITTVKEALRLIDEVAKPNFKLILDVYFMSGTGRPIREQILLGARHLKYFHANDDNKGGPGFGSIDYREVADSLKQVGYSGYVSVEVLRDEADPIYVARKSLETLKKFFEML